MTRNSIHKLRNQKENDWKRSFKKESSSEGELKCEIRETYIFQHGHLFSSI